jgi:hypothetical protein
MVETKHEVIFDRFNLAPLYALPAGIIVLVARLWAPHLPQQTQMKAC